MDKSVLLVPESVVVHREGATRFAAGTSMTQEHMDANQRRLFDRWGLVDKGGDDGGDRECVDAAALPGAAPAHDPGPGDRRADRPGDDRSESGSALPAPARGGRAGQGRSHDENALVAWHGSIDVATGGSLAIVNNALTRALPAHGVDVRNIRYDAPLVPLAAGPGSHGKVWVTHLWPGLAPHPPPLAADVPWVVVQPWEMGPPPTEWELTWTHPKFRKLITFSDHSRQLFVRYTSLVHEQIEVIPCGVDPTVFSPDGPSDKVWPILHDGRTSFRALYVGGTTWRKGWGGGAPGADLLLAAWEKAFPADDLSVRLYIKDVGAETFYKGQTAGERIARSGRRDQYSYLPMDLAREVLAALYRSCHVLVAPSRAEGFCLPALEAMACGLPVIVPAAGPTEEFVGDDCGLRVPVAWHQLVDDRGDAGHYYECDVDSLARALRWCANHPDKAREMGRAGRDRAVTYSWDLIAEQYANVLRSIAQGEV